MYDIDTYVNNIECRLATPEELDENTDGSIPLLSYSSLTNYNRCPTLGVILKSLKRNTHDGRADKALEAGSVCHEVYSAIRLYQLIRQDLPGHAWHHAGRIFGATRREQLWQELDNADPKVALYNFAMAALYSSGYVDDPYDQKRTFTNIEDSLNDYINYYDYARWPVFVLDHDDPSSFVGIEIPVVFRLDYHFRHGITWPIYIDGVLDGIHYDAKDINRIVINENKTSSVIDASWYEQYTIDHQLTIYTLMASLVLHRPVTAVHLYGMPIPCGRRQQTGKELFHRYGEQHYPQLFQWILTALEWHHKFKDKPLDAPRFTHACRRYFKTCQMMPICDAPRDVQEHELAQMPPADNEHLQQLLDAYKNMHFMFSDERMQGDTRP